MKIIIRPVMEPQREMDLTNRLISAIAEELWRLYGGNERLDWLEAERHLERIVEEARREAGATALLRGVAAPAAAEESAYAMTGVAVCPRLGGKDLTLGHEAVGVIHELGDSVAATGMLRIGQRVAVNAAIRTAIGGTDVDTTKGDSRQ
jgi:hypothetical protein